MLRIPKPPAREQAVQGVALRLSQSLAERIDQHAEMLRDETGLIGVTRADAATALLAEGLEAVEKGSKRR